MSNLSDLLPAGASGKQVDFVATGTIGNKVTVGLKADGTVEAISETSVGQSLGTQGVYSYGGECEVIETGAAYDSTSNRLVVVFKDKANSNYTTAVVGEVSGTGISFTYPSVVFNSASTDYQAVAFVAGTSKVVIVYDTGSGSSAVVGTVSGLSISFGAVATLSYARNYAPVYDTASGKMVIYYSDQNSHGKAVVGTVSGTSISFGSVGTFQSSASVASFTANYDSTNSTTIVVYSRFGAGIHANIGTVSGTSISFGAASFINASSTSTGVSSAYDSANAKLVVAFSDQGASPSNRGTAVVGTVSGSSLSYGTPVVFNSAATTKSSTTYDSANDRFTIAYANAASAEVISGVVSGTSISFDTALTFHSSALLSPLASAYGLGGRVAILYPQFPQNPQRGLSVSYASPSVSSNSASFVGIADAAISSAATGTVVVQGGTITGLSSLTTGSKYYVQNDGTVTTVSSSVNAGLAISTTSLLLNGDS